MSSSLHSREPSPGSRFGEKTSLIATRQSTKLSTTLSAPAHFLKKIYLFEKKFPWVHLFTVGSHHQGLGLVRKPAWLKQGKVPNWEWAPTHFLPLQTLLWFIEPQAMWVTSAYIAPMYPRGLRSLGRSLLGRCLNGSYQRLTIRNTIRKETCRSRIWPYICLNIVPPVVEEIMYRVWVKQNSYPMTFNFILSFLLFPLLIKWRRHWPSPPLHDWKIPIKKNISF